MATEVLKLTAQIVISHASMSELTPQELVQEIKDVYNTLIALERGSALPEVAPEVKEAEVVKKPPVPLEEIVKDKYVVCLECGKNTDWTPRSTHWSARNTPNSGAAWPKRKGWAKKASAARNRLKTRDKLGGPQRHRHSKNYF